MTLTSWLLGDDVVMT